MSDPMKRRSRNPYLTITIERLRKSDADEIVRKLVAEFGAISIFVRPYEDDAPKAEEE